MALESRKEDQYAEDLRYAALQALQRLGTEIRRVTAKAVEGRTSSVMGGRGTGGLVQGSFHEEAVVWLDHVMFELGILRQEAP